MDKIDINKLIYNQIIDFCQEKGIKLKDFYSEIGITDVGFRKTWSNRNPKSIETLKKLIKFIDKYDSE